MTDNRIPVDLTGITAGPAILRQCYLTLLNAGGEDGDWIEILSEIDSRGDVAEVLADYFAFIGWDDAPTRARMPA